MKIVVGSDFAGLKLRKHLTEFLTEQGHEVKDVGTTEEDRTAHPLVARDTTAEFKNGDYDFGILVCGTGTGISIAANKVNGIRCALLENMFSAKIAKTLNKANFIAFGGETTHPLDAESLVTAYMGYEYMGSQGWVQEWDQQINDIEAENK